MDENRWPRPGPGMVLLFGVVGLIGGILVGLFNATGSGAGPGQAASGRRNDGSSTTQADSLPAAFYTVVLASIDRGRPRPEVDARAESFSSQGVDDVNVLDPARWSSLADNFWAICSGVFDTRTGAAEHLRDLRDRFPNLAGAYLKTVNNQP
jgi:hypothetical protein